MKGNFYKITEIDFEVCAAPDSLFIELVDKNGDAFMNVEYTDNKEFKMNFYKNKEHISIPLEKIEESIRILKERIKSID